MTENDPKFCAFKGAVREYLLSNCREFLELNPTHPSLRCLTVDAEWEKKFTSIWMMFSPDERDFLFNAIRKIPESNLTKLACAFVAGGAFKKRMEQALADESSTPKH